MTRRGANVRLLPPLVFLVPLAVTIGSQVLLAWPGPLVTQWGGARLLSGSALVLAGVAVFAAGGRALLSRGTTVIPWHEVTTVVTTGIYARTRNPIYVGDAVIYLGIAVATGSWLALLVLPALIALMNRFVIAREERYLTERFGTAYTAYAARVRRWL